MRRYLLTCEAREDLRSIGEFGCEAFGLDRALRFLNELEEAFRLLASQPAIGFKRPDLAPESVRFFVRGPAVIAYRWDRRPIEVLRVITGSVDLLE